jgi:hypothetical protein
MGIICACSLALPAFLDRYWPRSLTAKFSRLYSYLTSFSIVITRHSSDDNDSFGPSKGSSNGANRHQRLASSGSHLHHGKSGGLGGSGSNFKADSSYSELDEKPNSAVVMMRGDGGDIHRQTLVKAYGRGEEDVRDWTGAASGNGGILKRVDVEQSYP